MFKLNLIIYTGELEVVKEKAYSNGARAKVKCYGC